MEHRQRNWKRLLKQHKQLLLPSACDALTAKLIQQAGFPAYQIGGFSKENCMTPALTTHAQVK